MLSGSFVALVTPFVNGDVDVAALQSLVEFQLANGTAGIVPCGTTGEAATLTVNEREIVIRTVLDVCNGRISVIPGTGTNDTAQSITLTKMAADMGCTAALVVTPYYNKPPQDGLIKHFEAIAQNGGGIDLVLYNVPGRTSINMLPETTAALSNVAHIVAIKEASGDIEQIKKIKSLCDLTILSGDDGMIHSIMEIGGTGVISVAANIVPDVISRMCSSLDEAAAGQAKYDDLFDSMFFETNPLPVKRALAYMGKIQNEYRLPLCPMSATGEQRLHTVLTKYGVVE